MTITEDVQRMRDPAWNAWHELVVGCSVSLVWRPRDDEVKVGSGTILVTASSETVILTARHIIEESVDHGCTVVWAGEGIGNLSASRAMLHPDPRVDVGLIVPTSALSAKLRPHAEETRMVAARYDDRFTSTEGFEDAFVVMGYPVDIASSFVPGQSLGLNGFLYLCSQREPPIFRPDDDLLEFEWVERGRLLRDANGPVVDDLIAPDRAFGMSGGAREMVKSCGWEI